MKLPPDALGLLSVLLSDKTKARRPWLAWTLDLLVLAAQVQLLYWFVQFAHGVIQ